MGGNDVKEEKVPIEAALNKAGFGLYSFILICLAGFAVVSFACVGYGSTILVPASACELETTPAQQGTLAAAPVIGSVVGAVIWGYLADTRGRRKMLIAALLGAALVNSVASISVNWIMLMCLQLVASLFTAGLFTMGIAILSESVPMQSRNTVVLLVTSISWLSQGIMAVLAIPIIPLSFSIYIPALGIYWNSWRTLVLVYSLPCVVTAIGFMLVKESPKYLLSKDDEKGAMESLRTIHRINNLCNGKEFEVSAVLKEDVVVSANQSSSDSQLTALFKAPLLKYTLIMSTLFIFQQIGPFQVWLPTIANQFVQVLETGEGANQTVCQIIQTQLDVVPDPDATPCALNVTALLIVLAVGALQSTVNLVLSLIVNRTGRRNLVFFLAFLCGVAGILVNLVPNAIGSAVLFGIQLMGILVLGLYAAIIMAIFPTHLRAIALAIPMTVGRIGTFACIQIINLMLINNCEAGFYLFCSIFISSAIIASFLPDDRRLQSAMTPPKTEISRVESTPPQLHTNNKDD